MRHGGERGYSFSGRVWKVLTRSRRHAWPGMPVGCKASPLRGRWGEFKVQTVESWVFCHQNCIMPHNFSSLGNLRHIQEGGSVSSLECPHSIPQSRHQQTSDHKWHRLLPKTRPRVLFLDCTLVAHLPTQEETRVAEFIFSTFQVSGDSFHSARNLEEVKWRTSGRSEWQKSPHNRTVFPYLRHSTCNSTAFSSTSPARTVRHDADAEGTWHQSCLASIPRASHPAGVQLLSIQMAQLCAA